MPLSDLWQWSNSSQSSDGQSAERHSSSDESDVGGSDGSTDSSNESPAADPRILRRQIKRQKQTAKGRAAALKVKAMKKLGKQASLKPPDHPAERFRNDRRAKNEINRPGCNNVRLRRLRLLCSYMKGWCQAVMSFLIRFRTQWNIPFWFLLWTTPTCDCQRFHVEQRVIGGFLALSVS